VSYADTLAALARLKQRPGATWLNDASTVPPHEALRLLAGAFGSGRAKYPIFKKKHGRQAAESTTSAFRWRSGTRTLTLTKMDMPLDSR
jgi:putative transposase